MQPVWVAVEAASAGGRTGLEPHSSACSARAAAAGWHSAADETLQSAEKEQLPQGHHMPDN